MKRPKAGSSGRIAPSAGAIGAFASVWSAAGCLIVTAPDYRSFPETVAGLSSQMDYPALDGGGHRFGAVGHAEFSQDTFQMVFHGVPADIEHVSNFFVGQSFREFLQHLDLSRRQFFEHLPRGQAI